MMSQTLRKIPTTRGSLIGAEPVSHGDGLSWGAVLVGGLIGVALMVPLLLLWRGVAGALPAPGGLWPMLLPLPALIGAGWSAATLAGTARRRIAALHGVAVWALLLVIVTAAAIFAPETLQQVVPELAGAAPAGLGDLVLGTLALAGLFAAALGGIWGGPRRERGRA
jgi:hypothetical protein